jgi:hypothetical protein
LIIKTVTNLNRWATKLTNSILLLFLDPSYKQGSAGLKPDWEESFFPLLASFVVVVGIHHFLCLDLEKLKRNTTNYTTTKKRKEIQPTTTEKEKKYNQLQRKKGKKRKYNKNREVKKSNLEKKLIVWIVLSFFFLMDCYKKQKFQFLSLVD